MCSSRRARRPARWRMVANGGRPRKCANAQKRKRLLAPLSSAATLGPIQSGYLHADHCCEFELLRLRPRPVLRELTILVIPNSSGIPMMTAIS
eukprot:2946949-Prymnesium_polylepis.2